MSQNTVSASRIASLCCEDEHTCNSIDYPALSLKFVLIDKSHQGMRTKHSNFDCYHTYEYVCTWLHMIHNVVVITLLNKKPTPTLSHKLQ